jgi:hypothetical protein
MTGRSTSAMTRMIAAIGRAPKCSANVAHGKPHPKATRGIHQRKRNPAAHAAKKRSAAHPSGEKSHLSGRARPVHAAATIQAMSGSYPLPHRSTHTA